MSTSVRIEPEPLAALRDGHSASPLVTSMGYGNVLRMKTVVSSKGRIALPAKFRKQDRIRTGQRFEIERLEAGRYLLTKSAERPNEGVVAWLLDCPERGWFQPIASESTDAL